MPSWSPVMVMDSDEEFEVPPLTHHVRNVLINKILLN